MQERQTLVEKFVIGVIDTMDAQKDLKHHLLIEIYIRIKIGRCTQSVSIQIGFVPGVVTSKNKRCK